MIVFHSKIRPASLLAGLLVTITSLGLFKNSFSQKITSDSIFTEAKYIAALDSANEMTFERHFEYPFLLLLNEKQNEYYHNLKTINARKNFIKLYWKKWNPDPLLPENEWLLVFLKRCAYVKEHFSYSKPPYFDERGKYYLKYGEPFYRYKRLGGPKRVTLFNDRAMHDFVKELCQTNIFEYYQVLGNESWVYKFFDDDMPDEIVIHFVDEGSYFREIDRLDQAIIGLRRIKWRMWYWSDMIKERAFIMSSKHLMNLASEILEFEADLRDALNLGDNIEGLILSKVQKPELTLFKHKTENEIEAAIGKKTLPPAIYVSEELIQDIAFHTDITQFRGPDGMTRLEVTILSLIEKNLVEHISSSSSDTINVEYQCLVRDAAFNSIATDKMVTRFPVHIAASESLANAVGQLRVWASSQEGDITLQLKDLQNDKIGYLKRPLTIRDFASQKLMISDIQFLIEVNKTNHKKLLPIFEKENIIVASYPYENVHKSIPVLCYFEIYNLISGGISSEYEITIKVFSDKSRESAFKKFSDRLSGKKDVTISLIHNRSVIDDTGEELISIDFSNLESGPYVLEISVTDVQDENKTAKVQKQITVKN